MEMMSVVEILNNVESSVDYGHYTEYGDRGDFWAYVIRMKSLDSGFGHLVHDYLENGWAEGSEIGWDGGEITEGHHRLVMAILLCLDEVPVSDIGHSPFGFGAPGDICAHYSSDAFPIDIDD